MMMRQWVFPVPLFAAILFAPESPWWLVRRGRHDEALKSVKRLADSTVDHDEVVALIDHTVKLEREMNFGSSYLDCFKGVDLRRTEIAVVCWCAQTFVGFSIQSVFPTSCHRHARFAEALTGVTKPTSSPRRTCNLSTTAKGWAHQTSGMASSTALAMPLQQRFDRKSIWMAGICCMLPVMLAVGIMACMTQTKALQWAQGCILLVW
jgi:SP family general alpha glucoside:H+ symporter-like MFS transporter